MKVLIVDDEESVREVCRKSLLRLGYGATAAESGEEALALFPGQDFDCVLTDIHMAGDINGIELVSRIKRSSPSTDVIVMTGVPELTTAIPALKNGAYDYLIKPFDPGILESVMRRCAQKRELSAELGREKVMRQELEAAYAELQKVERLKEAILARVHHELRTPITEALLAAECLSTEPLSENARLFSRKMREGVERLGGIVEELLLFSDLRSGNLAVARAIVDLRGLVEKAFRDLSTRCEDKGLEVQIEFEGRMDVPGVDPDLTERAIRHLFLNAINFNDRGGQISVQGKQDGEGVSLSFSDTGIGIPDDALPLIGDAFYQAAEALTRKVGGLGLGLAIVRRIVEAQGGHVSVRSRQGKGSTFTLRFPDPRQVPV